jgi:hypothetical protein
MMIIGAVQMITVADVGTKSDDVTIVSAEKVRKNLIL